MWKYQLKEFGKYVIIKLVIPMKKSEELNNLIKYRIKINSKGNKNTKLCDYLRKLIYFILPILSTNIIYIIVGLHAIGHYVAY